MWGVKFLRRRKATMAELRFKLVNAQAANERMREQRDNTDRENNNLLEQLARMAAEKQFQDDHIRSLEKSLSDAREQLRQAQREIARVGQEAAEMALTADGLGLAMAELEKRQERKDFLDEDHRHVRLMDGAEDDL